MTGDEIEDHVRAVVGGVESFAQDMRDQGIHVGMGRNPVCVTCDTPWPCPAEQANRARS